MAISDLVKWCLFNILVEKQFVTRILLLYSYFRFEPKVISYFKIWIRGMNLYRDNITTLPTKYYCKLRWFRGM